MTSVAPPKTFGSVESSPANHSDRETICNLDLLRGLAAIGILFFHYQHFFETAEPGDLQPLYSPFSWLYRYGGWAVQFFWMLSGFIFFHTYSRRANIRWRDFFWNRVSRLYPMHFLTLCAVALLQGVSWNMFGKFQLFHENDPYHFFLNIFMASSWGLEQGYSFNAPIWSVSVEIPVYVLFFLYLRHAGIRISSCILWLIGSTLMKLAFQIQILDCAVLFWFGGLLNQAFQWVKKRDWTLPGVYLTALAIGIAAIGVEAQWIPDKVGIRYIMFPAFIWLAVSLESLGWSSGKTGLVLGNLTYSSYLIHVPVQMIGILLMDGLIGNRDCVTSPWFLTGFIAGVLFLAHFAYVHIELPAKQKLRQLARQ